MARAPESLDRPTRAPPQPLHNAYFEYLDGEARAWRPPAPNPGSLPDSLYFGEALAAMDRHLGPRGLRVYLTQDIESLPAYGRDVVALSISDESTRVPAYFDRVLAIFKSQAVRPLATSSVVREPSVANLGWWLVHLRAWRHHLPGAVAYLRRRSSGGWVAPVWLVPIGVYGQPELPVKPISERRYDVFFAGSIRHGARGGALRQRLAPKTIARTEMLRAAESLAARHPDLSIQLRTTENFVDSMQADSERYARELMDSKIALVPRGTTPDTARLWESLRYGCVLVADAVPRHRFWYDGAPILRLRGWRDLESAVLSLLAEPGELEDRSRRSVEWWRTRGAPEAVGAYMARKLRSILG